MVTTSCLTGHLKNTVISLVLSSHLKPSIRTIWLCIYQKLMSLKLIGEQKEQWLQSRMRAHMGLIVVLAGLSPPLVPWRAIISFVPVNLYPCLSSNWSIALFHMVTTGAKAVSNPMLLITPRTTNFIMSLSIPILRAKVDVVTKMVTLALWATNTYLLIIQLNSKRP